MYIQGTKEFEHHVATYGAHKDFGYKDFIPKLTGAQFDANAWAELFRQAGARYVIPVAEQHDGFAMDALLNAKFGANRSQHVAAVKRADADPAIP